jgi:transposase-like protein
MAKAVLSAPQFQTEAGAFAYVEARLWPNGPICHHCGERERIGRLQGKSTRAGLYKCYRCRKPFTVRMGTIFESSHLPLHLWLQVIHLMCASKKGIASRQVQRMLQCSMKTAWFLTHRIREAMNENPGVFYSPLGGAGATIKTDVTYVGGKAENRAYGPIPPKQAVTTLVERGGAVRSFHIPNVTASTLHNIVGLHAHRDRRFMTDEAPTYMLFGWNFASHGTVRHSDKEYVRGDVHTNTAEGYFSILKRGIFGVYHHVSEAHLKRYLCEFDFRYTHRIARGVDDVKRADLALEGVKGKRLTYRTTRRGRAASVTAPPLSGLAGVRGAMAPQIRRSS